MERVVLESIPFEPAPEEFFRKLHLDPESDNARQAGELLTRARQIAQPRAAYGSAFVEEKNEDSVVIEGITFESRVLAVNLEKVHRVFPYVATCGRELYRWAQGIEDILLDYWADAIMEMAVREATRCVKTRIKEGFALQKTATMNPGSLSNWPLSEQKKLFQLLRAQEEIGVELKPSMLMVPEKSVSGLVYPTEVSFENCQLCPREECPGRRAPYDPNLFAARYGH